MPASTRCGGSVVVLLGLGGGLLKCVFQNF